MAITMVREPSEQPNITNIDDIIPFRYAYGDQSGYVKGKGTELDYTINGSVFEIGSGRIVLQGVESDIDANGVSITVDNVATTRYYVVYYMVNLATNTVSISSVYDTAGYPTIDEGDDLTENSSGIARLPIYKFTALNGNIANVIKIAKEIRYYQEQIDNNTNKLNNISNAKTPDGNNIISIKKILWTGEADMSGSYSDSPNVTTIDSSQKYGGKKLEIVFKDTENGSGDVLNSFIINVPETSSSIGGKYYTYEIKNGFKYLSGDNYIGIRYNIDLYFDRTKNSSSYNEGIRGRSYQYTRQGASPSYLNWRIDIVKIYEIIE